jgi:low affinity Fe/Cu permease
MRWGRASPYFMSTIAPNPNVGEKPPLPKLPDPETPGGFSRFAADVASLCGSSYAFLLAVIVIVAWGITGPYFHYSDTWQLIINTATDIVIFLMVFLIQNTQNRDARAIHLKLDEIIRSHHFAYNEMMNIEKLSDEQLEELAKYYERIRRECDQRSARQQQASPPPPPEQAA